MKKHIAITLILVMRLSLAACAESNQSSTEITQNTIAMIDGQLQGIWSTSDKDSCKNYQIIVFNNGNYVSDVFVDGEKIDNASIGVYAIGIYMDNDQETVKNVIE